MFRLVVLVAIAISMTSVSVAEQNIATLRGHVAIDEEPEAPRMEQVEDRGDKRRRNYPMQPPTIPHTIDGYRVDLNSNKCLSCHSRRRTEKSQAPMVSVTHYMDRDGNFLAEVSPRRYFCEQCHMIQIDTKPLVESTFEDVDTIIERKRSN